MKKCILRRYGVRPRAILSSIDISYPHSLHKYKMAPKLLFDISIILTSIWYLITISTINDTMATLQQKTVLITGCSTGGIGWAVARVFHARGFHVFATVRNLSMARDLSELSNVEILELDVTVPQTITRCRDTVAKRTGGKLDILVNNAGVESIKPLLDVDISEAKRLYDVNVWGPLTMVQAFAPLLIEAKGVIVNQSSIDGVLSMAWSGKSS